MLSPRSNSLRVTRKHQAQDKMLNTHITFGAAQKHQLLIGKKIQNEELSKAGIFDNLEVIPNI